jgi:hypothetical protein
MSEDQLGLIETEIVAFLEKISTNTFNKPLTFEQDDINKFIKNEEINILYLIETDDSGMYFFSHYYYLLI